MRLIQGDCLEVMKTLPDNLVDAVVTDPPYNIGKAEWDKIPDYIEWCGKWILESQRVLKDTGSFYFFHNDMEQVADLMLWIRKNTTFVFKQMITWSKISEKFKNYGFVQQRLSIDMMRNYYNGFTEYCLFYTFQDETGLNKVLKQPGFYSLMKYFKTEREKTGWNYMQCDEFLGIKASYCYWDKPTTHPYRIPEEKHYKKLQETRYFKREYEDLRREYEDLRYTFNNQIVKNELRSNSNVWMYPPAPQMGHITPKPIALIENILLHSSNEGDTILDPFMGSGTTGVSCIKMERDFIGIEIDPTFFDIATKRIEDTDPLFQAVGL